MYLRELHITNYRNVADATLHFSPNVNCLVGANAQGKTNVLDAIYYLSVCRSSSGATDTQCVRHGDDFFLLEGMFADESGTENQVAVSVGGGRPKRVVHDGQRVRRLSQHIGRFPLVLISPTDTQLVAGGGEERRRFMDTVLSQLHADYLEAAIRYDRTLRQRNALLKQSDAEPDPAVLDVLEEMLAADADVIFGHRQAFAAAFAPRCAALYQRLSGADDEAEAAGIAYVSHLQRGPLREQLREGRQKERIVGYTLHGIHKDDLQLTLGSYPVRREASQGQHKTLALSLKLAQYAYLRDLGDHRTPMLLLDDIFDKLDTNRLQRIIDYVSSDALGQIFITDTDRTHTDKLLRATRRDYSLFSVRAGSIEGAE
ncbi:MAG: DNA replication and repair protein RecF [Alloprevotella sp.]|nr:DNA replication and repair protein RecF [Alloprevotella sp.]